MARALERRSPSSRRTSATRAMTPPSPSLFARMTMPMYLIDTISVMDQNINEITPNTSSGVARTTPPSIVKTVFRAYRGLVPMSPKTTPRAATTRAGLTAPPGSERPPRPGRRGGRWGAGDRGDGGGDPGGGPGGGAAAGAPEGPSVVASDMPF